MNHTTEIAQKDKTLLEVIKYEFEMLTFSVEKMRTITDQKEINIYLEVFLLHARNLICFLEAEGQKDDILITHFEDIHGESLEPIELGFDKDFKRKINKHCQHLSKERLNKKYGWKIAKIYNKIAAGIKKFYSQIQ